MGAKRINDVLFKFKYILFAWNQSFRSGSGSYSYGAIIHDICVRQIRLNSLQIIQSAVKNKHWVNHWCIVGIIGILGYIIVGSIIIIFNEIWIVCRCKRLTIFKGIVYCCQRDSLSNFEIREIVSLECRHFPVYPGEFCGLRCHMRLKGRENTKLVGYSLLSQAGDILSL